MSERKVLNKYYPPDFDPSKIPRMKLARNRQYTVRLMAPFNMRCKTCGEYIYKGKKFNARKEDVEGDDYLGIRIYRFYIKCTRCLQEISFKTDPKNTDYEIEAGATRNFMALKLAEEQAQREENEKKEEEATNPMKLLEKRTQQSKQELELLESLEELKDLNRRQQTIDYDQMLEQYDTGAAIQKTLKEQEGADEEFVKAIFEKKNISGTVVEEEIAILSDDDVEPPTKVSKVGDIHKNDSISGQATEPRPVSADSSNSVWSSKQSVPLIKHKISNLGVKIVTKPPNEKPSKICTEIDEQTQNAVRENGLAEGNTRSLDPLSFDIRNGQKNGLSLLGSYSGTSSDDSD